MTKNLSHRLAWAEAFDARIVTTLFVS